MIIVDLGTREDIVVKLDKERRVKYTLNSLALLQKKVGNLDKALEGGLGNLDDIIYLIWLGLKHEDATLTVEQVGEMIDASSIGKLMSEAITPALNQDIMVKEETKNNVAPKKVKEGKK